MGGLDSHGLPRTASKVILQERAADPSAIGFAYGGVFPGVLHAHGQLHAAHKVTYSIGRAGRYLLHGARRQRGPPTHRRCSIAPPIQSFAPRGDCGSRAKAGATRQQSCVWLRLAARRAVCVTLDVSLVQCTCAARRCLSPARRLSWS